MTDVTVERKNPIALIEEEMLTLLKAELDEDFYVDRYPDDPESFDFTQFSKVVLIHYTGSDHSPVAVGNAAMRRVPQYAVHLACRNLGRADGSYEYLDRIISILQRQRIAGGRVHILKDSLSSQSEGLWHWMIDVAHTGTPSLPIRTR